MSNEKTGKGNKKLKVAGLVLFLLILMAGIAFFIYFLIREQNRAAHFEKAVASFNAGDYPLAKRLFSQVIAYDKNNEKAHDYFAQIFFKEGRWDLEAEYWKKCMQLNQFESRYKDNYCRALARQRNFSVLATQFRQEFLTKVVLSEEYTFYCLLGNGMVNGWKATEEYRKNLQEKKPEFFNSEYGRCLTMLIEWGDGKEPDAAVLEGLVSSSDPVVAFESMNIQAELLRRKKDEKGVEDVLGKQAELNRYAGLQLLASFHMFTYKFKQAADEFFESWEKFKRPIDAMMYGENLLLSDQSETLQEFSRSFQVPGKGGILAGIYLECLAAFAAGDMEKLSKTLPRLEEGFGTPITLLMQMTVAFSTDNAEEMEKCWKKLLRTKPFYDFDKRMDEMMHGYIHSMIVKKKYDIAAKLLMLPMVNWKRDAACAQIYVVQKLNSDSLTEKQLQDALKLFPENVTICQSGAEYYYKKEKFDECMKLIDQALALNPPDDSRLRLLQTFVLARRGLVDEAAPKLLQAVVEQKKETWLLRMFCEYCVKVNRKDYLDKLAKALENDTERQGLRHFVIARALVMEKKDKEALDEMEKVDCEDGDILFLCALRLALVGRHEPALRLYQKMLKLFPDNPHTAIVRVNISEIYLEQGKVKEALAIAEEAWKQAPGDDRVVLCYASKLNAAGEKAKLIQVVPLAKLLSLNNNKLTEAWKKAAEHEIERLFNEGSKWASEELCMSLLKLDSKSPVATEFMKKLHPEEEKEKQKAAEAAKKAEEAAQKASEQKAGEQKQ